jgi:hypothetical protein
MPFCDSVVTIYAMSVSSLSLSIYSTQLKMR